MMFQQLKPKTFIHMDWVAYWHGWYGCSSPSTRGLHAYSHFIDDAWLASVKLDAVTELKNNRIIVCLPQITASVCIWPSLNRRTRIDRISDWPNGFWSTWMYLFKHTKHTPFVKPCEFGQSEIRSIRCLPVKCIEVWQ